MRCVGLKNMLHQHLSPNAAGIAPISSRRSLFVKETPDDVWLHEVGKRGWIVVGQDYKYHENVAEFEAIKQHAIRVFYLWGAESSKWEKLRCFARGYDNVHASLARQGPFIYRITKSGKLEEVPLPK